MPPTRERRADGADRGRTPPAVERNDSNGQPDTLVSTCSDEIISDMMTFTDDQAAR